MVAEFLLYSFISILTGIKANGMSSKRLVFYFTATGNNLYVARHFSSDPLSIPQVMKKYANGPMHWEVEEIGNEGS